MISPRPSDIRARSDLLAGKFPPPADGSDQPDDPLWVLTNDAVQAVQAFTGRLLGDANVGASPFTDAMEVVPAGQEGTAYRATAYMAEEFSVMQEKRNARRRAGRLRLRSFTAGPYSEQYWDPAMVRGGQSGIGRRPQIVDDPELDDLLWQLATDDARDTILYLSQGLTRPIGKLAAFDYRRQGGGYFPSYANWRQALMLGGPDGI